MITRRCLLLIGLLSASTVATAAAPEAKYLFPAGAARGATARISVGGNLGGRPLQAWVSRPGVSFVAAEEKGTFSVTVAPDAAPGACLVRMYNAEGAAVPLPFVVGTLPELNELEPNDSPAKAHRLPGSICTVNGRLEKRGDVDVFAVSLTKNQTLVAAVAANETLASPMDAVLQIVSPRGSVLAQNDDERGLDPLLAFTAPADGLFLLRLFAFPATADASISFAGGETFVYRLTLTTAGFVDGALPLAAPRGGPANVEVYGFNLAEADARRTIEPLGGAATVELFSPAWAGCLSLPVVDIRSLVEAEPNDAAHPQPLELPMTVSGRIGKAGDRDAFRLPLTKGQIWRFKLESRSLGYPLDAVLRLLDASGKTIATADDTGANADAALSFTATADGDYTLIVSDLYEHGGPRYFYRLSLVPLEPDFSLTVARHAFIWQLGQPLEIPVTIDRLQNFAGDIHIEALGLPGNITIVPGRSAAKDDTAKTVKLVLTGGTAEFVGSFRIAGRAATPAGRSQFAHSLEPAGQGLSDLWLTISK